MTYRMRHYRCESCGTEIAELRWDTDLEPICVCGKRTLETINASLSGNAPFVIGDEIDIEIRHGICNADGTPRRFRSRTELKKAERAAGYCVLGDTPHARSESL